LQRWKLKPIDFLFRGNFSKFLLSLNISRLKHMGSICFEVFYHSFHFLLLCIEARNLDISFFHNPMIYDFFTLTHKHALSLKHTHTHALSLSQTHTHTLSLSNTHTHSQKHTLSLSHAHTSISPQERRTQK